MTFLLYFLNVGISTGSSVLSKKFGKTGKSTWIFNTNKGVAGLILFIVFGLIAGMTMHLPTLAYGLAYGVLLILSMYFGLRALTIGPLALTSIISAFSLIVPVIYGIFVWNESLSTFKIIGLILVFASIILLNLKLEGNLSFKWLIFALITLLTNGFGNVIQKYHQISYPGEYQVEFMIAAFIAVTVITVLLTAIMPGEKFEFNRYGALAGCADCTFNYIILYLSAHENATVLFPLTSVAKIIAVWIVGVFAFKEKLKLQQLIGLFVGIAAVILLKI